MLLWVPACAGTNGENIRSAPAVTRGLDPRVHLFQKMMDCRVKPGNDTNDQFRAISTSARCLIP
jgi:hypothetical protein